MKKVLVLILILLSVACICAAREIVVNSTADSGTGTLRWALQTARSGDIITFGPTIFPLNEFAIIHSGSPLPAITCGSLMIDASYAGGRHQWKRRPR